MTEQTKYEYYWQEDDDQDEVDTDEIEEVFVDELELAVREYIDDLRMRAEVYDEWLNEINDSED